MSYYFRIPVNSSFSFPYNCFICGEKPEGSFKIYGDRLRSIMPAFLPLPGARISYDKMKLDCPVCKRHKYLLIAMKHSIWILLLFLYVLLFQIKSAYLFLLPIWAMNAFLYFYLKWNFRIINISDYYIDISIRKKEFADKFAHLNNFKIITERSLFFEGLKND